jgi:amino acid transporter
MAYALAKDGLLPASYARVDPLTNSPTRALALVFVADALVLCLPLLRCAPEVSCTALLWEQTDAQ